MIVLGGGVIKHHINNANLMRNGADFSVCINTASEWDGSDAGARPDEAKSWGKIAPHFCGIKVYSEVSLILAILIGKTLQLADKSFNFNKKVFKNASKS